MNLTERIRQVKQNMRMEEKIMARKRAGKIKQAIALMLVSILLVFSATGCGKTSSAKKEEQIVFRMAIVDGEASPIYKGAKKWRMRF